MQNNFRKWAIGIVAFLLCFSLVINIHCVLLLFRYRQIYQAPPIWMTETGQPVGSNLNNSVLPAVKAVEDISSPLYEQGPKAKDPVLENSEESIENPSEEPLESSQLAPKQSQEGENKLESAVVSAGDTVYLTKSGTKFHRDGCSSLSKSKIAISYEDALSRGFEPCGRCKP